MDRLLRPRPGSVSDFQFGAVATETIEDTLLHLAQQNEQAVQEAAGRMGSFRETRIVEFVFLLSEQWCLEKSVSYQAVEILERFMVKQAEDICMKAPIQLRANEKTESWNWKALKEQLFNKFILRLVSCVQLASKLSFHYKIISNITVLNFLQALGYLYTKEELLESELDVLKSLNFQINLPTPLAYVEMLLEVLGTSLGQKIEKFISVKEDFMLLAVGIIAASAFIQNHECWSQVVGHLQSITGIAVESIAEFSYAILTHSVGANTPGRQQPAPPHLADRARRGAASST
ncbi:PREDICTED: cyclin N-terminal domain-containing protein 1 [Dipodomys ordii]|uniref:Cyclin N-terminal domain-containing protein 1 n=1 Tax=Dipodomys ordii TaxID=10020 RepID=A0A1S3GVK1_DIPOR|nr:PREDICTED: cyclin N-terminal domain-containing protein 1 [Dipodomys ordii]